MAAQRGTGDSADGHVSVVTEIGEDGPSVTNAAEKVYAALQQVRPGCRVIEHYLADSVTSEHYDEILPAAAGEVTWRRVPDATLRALLGDMLDSTRPTGPVVDGIWA